MSLLNDMLKDLNSRAPHHPASVIIPSQSKFWFKLPSSYPIGFLLLLFAFASAAVYTLPLKTPSEHKVVLTSSLTPIPEFIFAEEDVTEDQDESHDMTLESDDDHLDDITLETEDPPDVKNKLVHFTTKDWYNEHINQALEAIQDGNDRQAIELLTSILTQFPNSIEARENLAALYLSNDEITPAIVVLDEGLQREPHNFRLITMKARLLVEQGQSRDALALLEQFTPNINTTPDYYALLAAVFESLGRTEEAGSLYQTLIKIDPSNGQYWLGLGVALEHKHSIQQAIEAYKRASQSDHIQPAVRSYAENRLKTLQG